jgi:hypothetical protein
MKGAARNGGVLMLVGALVASVAASCTVVHHPGSTTTTSSGGSGSGTGGSPVDAGGNPAVTGRAIFESTVQGPILMECGACHQLGGVSDEPFLAGPDVYVTITSWPGFITADPTESTLVTHSQDPSHGGGQAPHPSATLLAAMQSWLAFEAAHLPMPDGGGSALIPPFKPFLMGAFNAVYLDPLGTSFQNSSITFNATELGNPPSMLLLENIQVHPIAGISLHIVHPLFTVYQPAGAEIPDPVDSFSGFDETYTLGSDPTLGPGSLVLSQWAADSRMSIAFETITATPITGGTGMCKDVATFQSDVVPQLMMWPCASMCHGGTNVAAQQQMDLSMIAAMPPDAACAQVLARITPGDPTTSQILVVTDPTQQAVHLFKFAGNTNNYNTFKAAVTPWIMAEQ